MIRWEQETEGGQWLAVAQDGDCVRVEICDEQRLPIASVVMARGDGVIFARQMRDCADAPRAPRRHPNALTEEQRAEMMEGFEEELEKRGEAAAQEQGEVWGREQP